MRRKNALLALAALVAVPLAALGVSRVVRHDDPPATEPPPKKDEPRPTVDEEEEGRSEPGGTLVVLGLFGILAALGTLVAAFVFPPGYVAAVLVFGLVSLLGLVVLYVHFLAHARNDSTP